MSETQARREFLRWATASALGATIASAGQQGAASSLPPPKKARITSSIMLGILKGPVEDKLRMVAEIGIQSAEINQRMAHLERSRCAALYETGAFLRLRL